MLALKLLLVPSFLALVSLAGRRWGPEVAGWLAGFPAVAGSILFVLALERGASFAVTAAAGSLSAVMASISFSLVYSHVCLHKPWMIASPLALLAWALVSIGLSLLPVSLPMALVIAVLSLLAAPRLFPVVDTPILPSSFDNRELLVRMAAGAGLTLVVSALAAILGPARSGIFGVFPVIGSVLTIFSQRSSGPAFVVALTRAMVRGLWSFTVFCTLLALLLPRFGIAVGFAAATVSAVLVQALMRQRKSLERPDSFPGR